MVNKEVSEDMLGDTGDGSGGGDYPEETRSTTSGDDSQQRISAKEADEPPTRATSSSSVRLSPTSLFCSVPLNRDVQSIIDTFPKTEVEKTKTSRKIPCLYCDRTFVADNLRQKHVERSHSIKQARRSSSRFQQSTMAAAVTCLFCDKFTLTENKLRDLFQHLVSAHPGKYFGCLECQERFAAQGHLEEHNARFHGIKRQVKVQSNEEEEEDEEEEEEESAASDKKRNSAIEESSVVKTRHKAKMKERGDESKKPVVRRGRSLVLPAKKKESRHKKISVKSTKLGVKRSARLQTKVVVPPAKGGKKRPKPKERVLSEETKSSDKEKEVKVSSSENPYPTFDAFYRVKKITDHSIDNLRITSLTFNDVFDQAFYNRIKCNIRENLLNHLDGKLFENEESESRISNFEKTQKAEPKANKSFSSSTSNSNSSSTSENYGCEISLNAATPVPHSSLSATTAQTAMSQFGDDPESQIEYGSKAASASNSSSKKKSNLKQDEVHYKYFTRRKYQASILESKENRDLSKLDMWTQLLVKRRQQKIVRESKTDRERSDYKKGEEYRSEKQKQELNRILDRRGPFEDLKEEASRKAALEGRHVNQEAYSDVAFIIEDLLGAVFSKVAEDVEIKTELTDSEIPSYLNLRKTSTLPNDSHVDKSDKITLICSSQETENFEIIHDGISSTKKDKNALVELSGEWARARLFVCAACGLKTADMRSLIDHKNLIHRNVWCQHYEFVGNQGKFYKHLSIPGMGKMERIEKDFTYSKSWKRSEARVCTKCTKQCNSLGELHRHVLECGEDWSWMLVRKKCKYKPFGTKTRKKRRGLFKRIIHKEKPSTEDNREKKTYKKEGPRVKPSDADTIQRMLANLPPKRATRKIMCLKDGFPKISRKTNLKKTTPETLNENSAQTKKRNARIRRNRVEMLLQQQDTNNMLNNGKRRRIMKGRMKCNPVNNIRKSMRNLNKVISSAIIDNNSTLMVKRKLKNAVEAKKQQIEIKNQQKQQLNEIEKEETEIDDQKQVDNEKQQTEVVRKTRRAQQQPIETKEAVENNEAEKKIDETNETKKLNAVINTQKVEAKKPVEVKKQLVEPKKQQNEEPIEVKKQQTPVKKTKPEKKSPKVVKKKQTPEVKNEETESAKVPEVRKTRSSEIGPPLTEQTSTLEKLESPVKKKVRKKKNEFGKKLMRTLSLRKKKVTESEVSVAESEVIVNSDVDTDNTKNNGKRKSRLDSIKKAVKKIRLVKKDVPKESENNHFLENVASDTAADTVTVITPKAKLSITNQQPTVCDNSVEEAAAIACADDKQVTEICVRTQQPIVCDNNVMEATVACTEVNAMLPQPDVCDKNVELVASIADIETNSALPAIAITETKPDLPSETKQDTSMLPNENICTSAQQAVEPMPATPSIEAKQERVALVIPNIRLQQPDICDKNIEEATTIASYDKTASASAVPKAKLCKRNKGLNACIAMLTSKLQQQKDDVVDAPVNLVKKRTPAVPVLIIPKPICLSSTAITIKEEIIEEAEPEPIEQELDLSKTSEIAVTDKLHVSNSAVSEKIEEAKEFNLSTKIVEVNKTNISEVSNDLNKTCKVSEDSISSKIVLESININSETSKNLNETNLSTSKTVEHESSKVEEQEQIEGESRKEINAETLETLDQNKPHPEIVESHNPQKQAEKASENMMKKTVVASLSNLETTTVEEKENIVLEQPIEQKSPSSEHVKVDIIKCFEDINSKENINGHNKNGLTKPKQRKIGKNRKNQVKINMAQIEVKKKQIVIEDKEKDLTKSLPEESKLNTAMLEEEDAPIRQTPGVRKLGQRRILPKKRRKRRTMKLKKRIVEVPSVESTPSEKPVEEIHTKALDLTPSKSETTKNADDESLTKPEESIKKLIKEPKLILDGGNFKIQSPIKPSGDVNSKNPGKFSFPHSKESFMTIKPSLAIKDFFNFNSQPQSLIKQDFFNFTNEPQPLIKPPVMKDLFSFSKEAQPLIKPPVIKNILNLDPKTNQANETLKEKPPVIKDFFSFHSEAQPLIKPPVIKNVLNFELKTNELNEALVKEKISEGVKNIVKSPLSSKDVFPFLDELQVGDLSLRNKLFKQKNKSFKTESKLASSLPKNVNTSINENSPLPDSLNFENKTSQVTPFSDAKELNVIKNKSQRSSAQLCEEKLHCFGKETSLDLLTAQDKLLVSKNKTSLVERNPSAEQTKSISESQEDQVLDKNLQLDTSITSNLENKTCIDVQVKPLSDSEDELPLASIAKTKDVVQLPKIVQNTLIEENDFTETVSESQEENVVEGEQRDKDKKKNKKKGKQKKNKIDNFEEPVEVGKKKKNKKGYKSESSEDLVGEIEKSESTSLDIENPDVHVNKECAEVEKPKKKIKNVECDEVQKLKTPDECDKIDNKNHECEVFKKPEPIITKITISKIHIMQDTEEKEKRSKKKDKKSKRRTEEMIDVLEQEIIRLQNAEKLLKAKKHKSGKKNKKKELDLSKFDSETVSLIKNLEDAIRDEISTEHNLTLSSKDISKEEHNLTLTSREENNLTFVSKEILKEISTEIKDVEISTTHNLNVDGKNKHNLAAEVSTVCNLNLTTEDNLSKKQDSTELNLTVAEAPQICKSSIKLDKIKSPEGIEPNDSLFPNISLNVNKTKEVDVSLKSVDSVDLVPPLVKQKPGKAKGKKQKLDSELQKSVNLEINKEVPDVIANNEDVGVSEESLPVVEQKPVKTRGRKPKNKKANRVETPITVEKDEVVDEQNLQDSGIQEDEEKLNHTSETSQMKDVNIHNENDEILDVTCLEQQEKLVDVSVVLPRLESLVETSDAELTPVSKGRKSKKSTQASEGFSNRCSSFTSISNSDTLTQLESVFNEEEETSPITEIVKPVPKRKGGKKRGRKVKNQNVPTLINDITEISDQKGESITEDANITDEAVEVISSPIVEGANRGNQNDEINEPVISDVLTETRGRKQNKKVNYNDDVFNFDADLEETNSQEVPKLTPKSKKQKSKKSILNKEDLGIEEISEKKVEEIVHEEKLQDVNIETITPENSTEGNVNENTDKETSQQTVIVEETPVATTRGRKPREKVKSSEALNESKPEESDSITPKRSQKKKDDCEIADQEILTPRRGRKQKNKKINYNVDELFNFVDENLVTQEANTQLIQEVTPKSKKQKSKEVVPDEELPINEVTDEKATTPLKQNEVIDKNNTILSEQVQETVIETPPVVSKRGRKPKNKKIEEKDKPLILEEFTEGVMPRARKQKTKKINYNESIDLFDYEEETVPSETSIAKNDTLEPIIEKIDSEATSKDNKEQEIADQSKTDTSVFEFNDELEAEKNVESEDQSKTKKGKSKKLKKFELETQKVNDVQENELESKTDTSVFEFNEEDDLLEETQQSLKIKKPDYEDLTLKKVLDDDVEDAVNKSNSPSDQLLNNVEEIEQTNILDSSKHLKTGVYEFNDFDEGKDLEKVDHEDEDDDSPLIKIIDKILPSKKTLKSPRKIKKTCMGDDDLPDINLPSKVIKISEDIDSLDDSIYELSSNVDSNINLQEDVTWVPMSFEADSTVNTSENKITDDEEDDDCGGDKNEDNLAKINKNKKKKKTKVLKKSKKEIKNIDTHCEICDKNFVRADSLIKHKRTLTHIAKLSEIEAREAEERKKEQINKSNETKQVDEIIKPSEIEEAEETESVLLNKEVEEICENQEGEEGERNDEDGEIERSAELDDEDDESKKECEEEHVGENVQAFPPFTLKTNNDSLKLADIISDVLNKPVEEENEMQRDAKPYKSLGERKSFDSDSLMFNPPSTAAYIGNKLPTSSSTSSSSTGAFLETQISLLENIIENKGGNFTYIDEISNKSDERCSSDMSLVSDDEEGIKQDDSNIMSFSHNPSIVNSIIQQQQQHSSEKNFVKPGSQYEEISEDTRNFEEQRARKALNRDEELFLECCSLLKSSSEISDYGKKSGKTTDTAISMVNIYGLKSGNDEEESNWLQCEKQKTSYPNNTDNYLSDDDDNISRANTPIGDNYDDFSNSNTIRTDWNSKKGNNDDDNKEFEDISLDSLTNSSENNSNFNSFEMSFNDDNNKLEQNKQIVEDDKFDEDIEDNIDTFENSETLKSPSQHSIKNLTVPLPKSSDSSTSSGDSKKVMTKGAMKVFFEGLKVSIPTRELDMTRVLDRSPTMKKIETSVVDDELSNSQNDIENTNVEKVDDTDDISNKFENKLPAVKVAKNKRMKVPQQEEKLVAEDEDDIQLHHNENTKKSNKVQNTKKCHKVHDIYDFEETQDNTDLFLPNNLKTFRSQLAEKKEDDKVKVDEKEGDVVESDLDSNNHYVESFSVEAQSVSSFSTETESSLSMVMNKKKKNSAISNSPGDKNITKKKCVIMGRIFKNAAFKAKTDEINDDIAAVDDNTELVENYVMSCQQQPDVDAAGKTSKNKMSEQEMDLLFNKLLEDDVTVKKSKKKKTEAEKELIVSVGKEEEKSVVPAPVAGKKQEDVARGRPKCAKRKKRTRKDSESSEDEFNINKRVRKKRARGGKKGNKEDESINLEQELKECMGVAGRKSQRKCTSGKQNILAEDWSSDDSEFEAMLRLSAQEAKANSKQKGKEPPATSENSNTTIPPTSEPTQTKSTQKESPIIEDPKVKTTTEEEKPTEPSNKIEPISEEFLKEIVKDVTETNRKPPRKSSNNNNAKKVKVKEDLVEIRVGKVLESTLASNRRKRAAADDRLYYWSSSSEDEDNSQNVIEVKSARRDDADDGEEYEEEEDRPVQHGWIVGDSPKKLVTMLAQAKGKKIDTKCVKEQKKRTTI